MIHDYFDKVYVLNLHKRPERMRSTEKRMAFCDIEFERFGAVDGSVMNKLWETYFRENQHFSNPSYLGCAMSHLSMYRDALEKGYKRILILEDDNRIHRLVNKVFDEMQVQIPEWNNLLYLGYIPLSDDCTRWDYSVNHRFIATNVFLCRNLWGLYAYGIHEDLMREVLDVYHRDFPMELDRFFVTEVQPRGMSLAVTPQLFAADDGVSDNSGRMETSMLDRSIDARFANKTDYV